MLAFSTANGDYYAMLHAELALFDDEPQTLDEVQAALTGSEHRVAVTATTREASLGVLDAIYAGSLAIDAVLLDGKMDSGDFSDAIAIEQQARRYFGRSLPIIGISMDEMAGRIVPIERRYDLTKLGIVRLSELLDSMPSTVLERH